MDAPLLPALPGYDDPQLIAHGTSALVFRARQTRLNRMVAIKVITVDTGSVPVNAARELATTVSLSSQPHIVSIIDTGITDDDRPYIVMEYCEGGSYAQILRQTGVLPIDDVVEVGVKIGEALHAAHQAGIVHRDVKPSNILRSRFGPALTDFGIARAPDELMGTLTREMMTPHHASPEALLHQAQSGLSDVYSLASTMWTLLVGHPPFVDPARPPADLYAFRDRVLHDPLPALARDDVPGWLNAELTKAMSKLPAQRHASAMEFAEALRRGTLGLAASPVWSTPPRPAGTTTTATPAVPGDAARGVVHVAGLPASVWPAEVPRPVPVPTSAPPVPAQPSGVTIPGVTHHGSGRAAVAPRAADDLYVPPSRRADDWDEAPPLAAAPAVTSAPPAQSRSTETPPVTRTYGTPAGDGEPRGRSARRFDGDELRRPAGRRIAMVLIMLVAVAGVAIGAALVLASHGRSNSSAAGSTTGNGLPSGVPLLTPVLSGAPTEVTLHDQGTSIRVTWKDPTAALVQFIVTGWEPNTNPTVSLPFQKTDPGVTSVTFAGLDPKKNYCFAVGAIYSGPRVAAGPGVCTQR